MTGDELKARMRQLPVVATPPEAFTWDRHRYELWHHVNRTDNPAQFLRWSTVEGTMVVGDVPYIREELAELRGKIGNIESIVRAPGFGGELLIDGWISPNLVHQAYHLLQLEEMFLSKRIRISDLRTIVEIGGGYGAMALAARRMGFSGEYCIYDLPEFSLLQEYYLSNVSPFGNALFVTDATRLPYNCDLLIGMWSLGEMPIEQRERIVGAVKFNNALFAYMPDFAGANNLEWFGRNFLNMQYAGFYWRNKPAACSSMYMIGARMGL